MYWSLPRWIDLLLAMNLSYGSSIIPLNQWRYVTKCFLTMVICQCTVQWWSFFEISWYRVVPAPASSYFWLYRRCLYWTDSHPDSWRRELGKGHHQNMGDIFKGIDIKFIGIYATCWGCIIGTYCASGCLGSSFHTSHKPITQGVVLRQHLASDDVRQLWYLRNYVWFLAAVWDYSCESRVLSFSHGFVLERHILLYSTAILDTETLQTDHSPGRQEQFLFCSQHLSWWWQC